MFWRLISKSRKLTSRLEGHCEPRLYAKPPPADFVEPTVMAFPVSAMEIAKQLMSTRKLAILGLCMVKSRIGSTMKADMKEISGNMCVVTAKPAKIVVMAVPMSALKFAKLLMTTGG